MGDKTTEATRPTLTSILTVESEPLTLQSDGFTVETERLTLQNDDLTEVTVAL